MDREIRRLFAKSIFALVITIVGFTIVFTVDWKIGLGVFLLVWGNNINK
jgi:hypothetical protein